MSDYLNPLVPFFPHSSDLLVYVIRISARFVFAEKFLTPDRVFCLTLANKLVETIFIGCGRRYCVRWMLGQGVWYFGAHYRIAICRSINRKQPIISREFQAVLACRLIILVNLPGVGMFAVVLQHPSARSKVVIDDAQKVQSPDDDSCSNVPSGASRTFGLSFQCISHFSVRPNNTSTS